MPLSEKAKGKQKAVEADGDGEPLQSNFEAKEVVVRFTEGIPDVNFVLDPSYTVQEVKLLVRRPCSATCNDARIDIRFASIDLPYRIVACA
jgi:hypothetical protein